MSRWRLSHPRCLFPHSRTRSNSPAFQIITPNNSNKAYRRKDNLGSTPQASTCSSPVISNLSKHLHKTMLRGSSELRQETMMSIHSGRAKTIVIWQMLWTEGGCPLPTETPAEGTHSYNGAFAIFASTVTIQRVILTILCFGSTAMCVTRGTPLTGYISGEMFLPRSCIFFFCSILS